MCDNNMQRRYTRTSRDDDVTIRDVHETLWAETRPETHVSETETRRCSFRAAGQDLEAPESLGSFSVSRRRFPWRMVISETHWQWHWRYGLINSHHGKRFLFVILWVFALYSDNYHWIINGLHYKELQLQCCRNEPICLSQFASNWN